ncbi:hypothetical protein L209DRAFT_611186 [Thermothelomyces heterothallicus CBS 203.75]
MRSAVGGPRRARGRGRGRERGRGGLLAHQPGSKRFSFPFFRASTTGTISGQHARHGKGAQLKSWRGFCSAEMHHKAIVRGYEGAVVRSSILRKG